MEQARRRRICTEEAITISVSRIQIKSIPRGDGAILSVIIKVYILHQCRYSGKTSYLQWPSVIACLFGHLSRAPEAQGYEFMPKPIAIDFIAVAAYSHPELVTKTVNGTLRFLPSWEQFRSFILCRQGGFAFVSKGGRQHQGQNQINPLHRSLPSTRLSRFEVRITC